MSYEIDFGPLLPYLPSLGKGALLTIKMTILASAIGTVFGILMAYAKLSRIKPLRTFCSWYIDVVRNTPFLVQIFLLYFGLAGFGVHLPTFIAAVTAMTLNITAYVAEIVRAGIESIPKGQIEAAQCLGLSKWRIALHVVLPPAIEKVYPSLTGQYILMMQASAMASQISAEELTAVANTIQSDTFRSLETFIVVAVVYVFLTISLKILLHLTGRASFKRARVIKSQSAPSASLVSARTSPDRF